MKTAQTHAVDDAANAWGDFMEADEQIREIGDYVETGGEIATEVALGAVAVTASAPAALAAGAVLVLDEMGKSLEAGAEDGEISQEDIVGEVVAGTVTAATLLAGRGLNNFLPQRQQNRAQAHEFWMMPERQFTKATDCFPITSLRSTA